MISGKKWRKHHVLFFWPFWVHVKASAKFVCCFTRAEVTKWLIDRQHFWKFWVTGNFEKSRKCSWSIRIFAPIFVTIWKSFGFLQCLKRFVLVYNRLHFGYYLTSLDQTFKWSTINYAQLTFRTLFWSIIPVIIGVHYGCCLTSIDHNLVTIFSYVLTLSELWLDFSNCLVWKIKKWIGTSREKTKNQIIPVSGKPVSAPVESRNNIKRSPRNKQERA